MGLLTAWTQSSPQEITRADLELNLVAAAYDFVRSAIASLKKIQLYPPGHQLIEKFVELPFGKLQGIFKVKTKLTFELINRRRLAVEGVFLKEDEYTLRLSEAMARNGVANIVLNHSITTAEMQIFLSHLFWKSAAGMDFSNIISSNHISGIAVNVEHPHKLFELQNVNFFDGDPQFTFWHRVRELLEHNHNAAISSIIGVPQDDKRVPEEYGFDMLRSAVAVVAEDLIEDIPLKEIISDFKKILSGKDDYIKYDSQRLQNGIRKLINLVGQKHGRAATVVEFKRLFSHCDFNEEELNQFFDDASRERLRAIGGAERFYELFETGQIDTPIAGDFSATVKKLITGNLWNPLKDLLGSLAAKMSKVDKGASENARLLASDLVSRVLSDSSGDVYVKFLEYLEELARQNAQNDKVAGLISNGIRKLLSLRRYSDALPLVHLFEESGFGSEIRLAYRQLILNDNISAQIALDLSCSSKQDRRAIAEVAMILGNEALAGKLIFYISHENKDLRSLVLRILTAIGEPIIAVLGKFLDTEIDFTRMPGQPALAANEWFKIRNVITVISKARLDKGISILHKLGGDADRRVRLEVARALEHIQGDEAIGILEILFTDRDSKVREAAVISIGLCGHRQSSKILSGLLETGSNMWPQVITSLGYIQSTDAVNLLMRLNQDVDYLHQCGFPRKEFENIRNAASKELEKPGNIHILSTSAGIQQDKIARPEPF